jgi:HD-GYP domain-containing protein (c-di-GMP phosphodiesterase class II)
MHLERSEPETVERLYSPTQPLEESSMTSSRSQLTVRRYWWQAIIATALVVVAPPLLVVWLEGMGVIDSALLGVVGSVAGSMVASTLGATLWMQFARSNDVVFSDLLPWGFLRRMLMEKRILSSTKLMRERDLSATGLASSSTFQVKTLEKLAAALEATDPYTHGHSRRVARLSCMIAKQLGLPKKRIRLIRVAAAVHDVGKLHVPEHIINKPGKLSPQELQVVQLHAAKGSEMVARTGNRELTALVRHHHERIDGKGYPDGIAGMKIPLGARIIAVADTFDAITSTRSYRSASKHKIAVEALRKAAGTQLDRDIVQAFLAYYSGKRSLARWAVLLSGPHRWFGELAGWFQGATAAGLKGSATAAVLTGTVLAGSAAAPAIAEHLPNRDNVSAAELASERDAKSSPGHVKGLPPGLAKKDQLPPGLRKKDELPPGLAKQVSGSKKAHPNPPGRNKDKHDESVVTAEDASSGKDKSETTEEVTSLELDDSLTTVESASSGKGNSAFKSSKK